MPSVDMLVNRNVLQRNREVFWLDRTHDVCGDQSRLLCWNFLRVQVDQRAHGFVGGIERRVAAPTHAKALNSACISSATFAGSLNV